MISTWREHPYLVYTSAEIHKLRHESAVIKVKKQSNEVMNFGPALLAEV